MERTLAQGKRRAQTTACAALVWLLSVFAQRMRRGVEDREHTRALTVTTPSVPSDPMKSCFKSGPTLSLRRVVSMSSTCVAKTSHDDTIGQTYRHGQKPPAPFHPLSPPPTRVQSHVTIRTARNVVRLHSWTRCLRSGMSPGEVCTSESATLVVAAWHAGNTNLSTQVERHDVIAVSQPQIKLLEHTASLAHQHTRRLVEGQDLVHEASGQYKLVVHRHTATD